MPPKEEKLSGTITSTNADKEFKCGIPKCKSKGFKTVGAKQRHEREQHGHDLKCDYCYFTAKRRYQMKYHMETDHAESIANTSADMSMGRASRGSVGSRSSEESAPSVLYQSSTGHQPFPAYATSFGPSSANTNFNSGNQYPMGPPYASSTYPPLYSDGNRVTLSMSDSQASSPAVRNPYYTTSQNDLVARPSGYGGLWESSNVPSRPVPNNLSLDPPATLNQPSNLAYANISRTPFQSGTSRGTGYTSPYSYPYGEQGAPFSQLTGNSYAEDSGQQDSWPKQPPSRPQ